MRILPFIILLYFGMNCYAGWVESSSRYQYESDPVAVTACVMRTGSVIEGNLALAGPRTLSIARTNTARIDLTLESWSGIDPFMRPKITLQAGRMVASFRESVTNVITYGLDESTESLSGDLFLNGLILRDGIYRGDGAGLSNLVEHDPTWEAAKNNGTVFGGEVRVPSLSMAGPDIRRTGSNSRLAVMAGDAWNNGAMLELGGDGLVGSDVQYGSGQILLKDNGSRFRIRDREGWTDIADFRGDGSSYFVGPLTVAHDLLLAEGGRIVVGGKPLKPRSLVAKGTIALYSTIPTNGLIGAMLSDMPPWAKTVTRLAGRLAFATNFPQDSVTNLHFYFGQCVLGNPLTVTNQQPIYTLKTNDETGVLTGILSSATLRQYVFDVPTSIMLTNYLNLSWYGYFHNDSTNAIPPLGGYYWEYWIEMID